MAAYDDREHFIPLRCTDLVNFLAKDRGPLADAPLGTDERAFRRFAQLLVTHYHIAYHEKFIALKDLYAPYDPDADTRKVDPIPAAELDFRRDKVFDEVGKFLEKANYMRLGREEVETIMEGSSAWGLEMHVDWDIFERVEFYVRGDETFKRSYRSLRTLYLKKEVDVPTFSRLVILIKQKAAKGLAPDADTDNVFIKLFKNMPKMDLEMVLPGTRPKLSKFDRAMIAYPLVTFGGLITYKYVNEIFFDNTMPIPEMMKKAAGGVALLALFGGYAYRSYFSWSVKKTNYTLQLTKSLYFQTLDSNAGVLHRLLDEAEEQEVREALLAYYYLWRHAPSEGWSEKRLDDYIEEQLQNKLGIKVDFEVADALDKLRALGLLEKSGDRLKVVPLHQALDIVSRKSLADAAPADAGTPDEQLLSSLTL